MVTPDGYAFYSMGVNHITPEGYYAPKLGYSPYENSILAIYGSKEKWAEATRNRLREWGFNTLGGWSEQKYFPEFPYTLQLDFSSLGGGLWMKENSPKQSAILKLLSPMAGQVPETPLPNDLDGTGLKGLLGWAKGIFPDVFDPEWEQKVYKEAERACAPRKNDPYLIGYFTDNELRFGPDWRGLETMLDVYMKLAPAAPGKKRLVMFFRERYGNDFSAFEKVWKSGAHNFEELLEKDKLGASWWRERVRLQADVYAFDGVVAERYFSVSAGAIKKYDPNHLILGCRFHALGVTPEVIKAAGKYDDLLSINLYYITPLQNLLVRLIGNVDFSGWMKNYYELSGKPILGTEFSYRAITSGLPNTKGAPVTVFSQHDRGFGYGIYAQNCQKAPYIVGYHWFNYMDEPKEGRYDGENSNYGLVNKDDRPYNALVKEITRVNNQSYAKHLTSSIK